MVVQLNRLTQFRQALYENGFTRRADAQMELLDALLLTPAIRSFPDLSRSPVFRRQWHSLYAALEDGGQDAPYLTSYLTGLVPQAPVTLFVLDESAWPRPDARTLEDRGYVHTATKAIDSAGIVVGHSYSALAFVAEPGTSWALPVSMERVCTDSDAVQVGLDQVRALGQARQQHTGLDIILGDTRYGNHRFLGGLEDAPCAVLVRLRPDRVLYRAPGPYSGVGRPAKHGARFAFKEPQSWGEPEQFTALEDERFGQVELRLWSGLHAKQDAGVVFSVLCAQVHLEREKPPVPLWLAWQGPVLPVEALWRHYGQRPTVEASFRYRKQRLWWTLPMVQTVEASQRWTQLVTLAQWTLYLARDLVEDHPLPWQKPQLRLRPERVRERLGGLFAEIGTPAQAPKRRGKSPGWPLGQPRGRRKRHRVVYKGKKQTQAA